MDNTYLYNASLTREPFLFYEMRTTAKLLCSGLSEENVVEQITNDNLFNIRQKSRSLEWQRLA